MFNSISIRRKLSLFLVFIFTFLFITQISSSWVNAKEKPKPEPKDWHIKGIMAALDDSYPKVQKLAFDKLGEYELKNLDEQQAKEIAEKAAKLLKDENENDVRLSAAVALVNLGDVAKPYVKDIADILKDEEVDSRVRARAAEALGNLGDVAKPYVKDIFDFLQDENVKEDYIRRIAARALGNLGDAAKPYVKDIFKDIFDFLKDEKVNPDVRASAAYLLADLGDAAKPHVKDILAIFKNEKVHPDVRRSAVFALGKLGDAAKPYVKDILPLLKDEKVNPNVRNGAAYALGNLGDAAKPHVKDILPLLKDEKVHPDVRRGAAYALGNLGDAAPVEDILAIVKDEKVDLDVRREAVEALGNLGDAAPVEDILAVVKDEKVDLDVRRGAVEALGNLGDAAAVKDILDILKDKEVDDFVRSGAAVALRNLGDAVPVKDILDILKDEKIDSHVRLSATVALGKIQKLNLNQVLLVLDNTYDLNHFLKDEWRFQTYFLAGETEDVKTLLKWLGHNDNRKITPKNDDEAKETLKLFAKIWEPSKDLKLRKNLADRIVEVTKSVDDWQLQDISLLQKHYKNLEGYPQADSIKPLIDKYEVWNWFSDSTKIILTHCAFWILLIFAYPKSPQIQAIFFWNPWVRKIFGFGYVSFAITWIPFLRRKIFEPFQPSLLADAKLDSFDEKSYFSSSRVIKDPNSKQTLTITEALPNIKGQTILMGDSGLGKSMFLRHLAKASQKTVVYLPASKCEQGVIAAIQAKLHGQAQDEQFLKNLIYSGAIDIFIDGINEVSADTRSQIKQFMESYFRGNIVMTTQPLEWQPPATAKIIYLKPLEPQQVEEFLISRQLQNGEDVPLKGAEYEQACQKYLQQAFDDKHKTPEELTAVQRVLSNPMDLTLVAQMLSQGKQPDLFRLQEQQYNLMAAEYEHEWGYSFRLKKFSESVYEMRINDAATLNAEEYHQELLSLEDEKYKIVISRQWQGKNGELMKEWYFRHDKIMDFFLVQNFLGDSEEIQARLEKHIGDSRFRGVYFLLANLLQPDAALQLRESLIQYAVDTNDHTVSDTFVKLLRSRVPQYVEA